MSSEGTQAPGGHPRLGSRTNRPIFLSRRSGQGSTAPESWQRVRAGPPVRRGLLSSLRWRGPPSASEGSSDGEWGEEDGGDGDVEGGDVGVGARVEAGVSGEALVSWWREQGQPDTVIPVPVNLYH